MLQVNKYIYFLCKAIEPIKRASFLRPIHHRREKYYVLPNGNREGPYKKWYADNTKAVSCNYRNGKLHGLYIQRLTTCPLIKSYFEDGLQTGPYEEYFYDNGSFQLSKQCFYKNNRKHGLCRTWYENADGSQRLASELVYDHGVMVGVFRKWSPDGKLIELGSYNDKGQRDGSFFQWYSDGQIKHSSFYANDKLEGLVRDWYQSNGFPQLMVEYFCKNGKIEGISRTWHYSGRLCNEAFYVNDKIDWFNRSFL